MKRLLAALITATAIAIAALVAVSPAGAQTLTEQTNDIAYRVDPSWAKIHESDGSGCPGNPHPYDPYAITGGALYTDRTGVIELRGPCGTHALEVTDWWKFHGFGAIDMSFDYNGHHFTGGLVNYDYPHDVWWQGSFTTSDSETWIELEVVLTPMR